MQGIRYLKKAAEQGHEMALNLLGACFRTGRGITAANEGEIRKFLEMSPSERSAKRAAQELFASLSGGEEFVTVEQLEKRMREIYKLQKRNVNSNECEAGPSSNGKISIKSREDDENNDVSTNSSKSSSPVQRNHHKTRLADNSNQISEASLVEAAHNYSNGIIPAVNQVLTISVPNPQTLDHVPCLHRLFLHPTMFLALLYHRFISILSSFPPEDLARFQIVISLVVYAIISIENFLVFIPTAIFYLTFASMIVTSFKILKSKHEFVDFRIWSGLFLSYDNTFNANESENLYLRNNVKPYIYFFLSFAVNLMIYPLISDQWLPHSEITVISFLLIFITISCFMFTSSPHVPDFLMLFSFACNVLAKYPYEMDSVVNSKWRFLDLQIPGFSTFVFGSGIEFSMNCRGVLYLTIPIFLFFLAKRRQWRGIFQFLFPHCVTLAWLQICIISSQSATTFGLVRSTLGLAGVFLFLPLFGLVTLLIPVFAAVEWMSLTDLTNRIVVTLSTLVIAILGSCLMAVSNRTGKYVTMVQISICVLASCLYFTPYMFGDKQSTSYSSYFQQTEEKVPQTDQILDALDDSNYLSWDLYHKYCFAPHPSNRIKTQLRCSHLEGSEVYWEGVVSDVGISSVKNWQKNLIQNYLPDFISNFLTCYFGEMNQASCFEELCEIKDYIDSQKRCNLNKFNIYKYEVEVKVAIPTNKGILNLNTQKESKVIIQAENVFGNFTQKINLSDKIWFKGALVSSLIAKSDELSPQNSEESRKITRINLSAIGCLQCSDKSLSTVSLKRRMKIENQYKDVRRAFIYLLNVLFNPLVTFK
jgi:wolfamin